jgi:hypothetical protein
MMNEIQIQIKLIIHLKNRYVLRSIRLQGKQIAIQKKLLFFLTTV